MNRFTSSLCVGLALVAASAAPAVGQDDNLSEISGPASGGSSVVGGIFSPGTVGAVASPAVTAALNAAGLGLTASLNAGTVAVTGINGAALILPPGMAAGIQSALSEALNTPGNSAGLATLTSNLAGLGVGGLSTALAEGLAGLVGNPGTGQLSQSVGDLNAVVNALGPDIVMLANNPTALAAAPVQTQLAVATLLTIRAALVQLVTAAASAS